MRAVASSIPMHSVQGVATFIRSEPFHFIASSFHQPPPQEKQECFAPLRDSANPHYSAKNNFYIFLKEALSINPKNKKESKCRGLTKANAHGLQG